MTILNSPLKRKPEIASGRGQRFIKLRKEKELRKIKLKHIVTKIFVNDVNSENKYMVEFISNKRGIVYKNGRKIDDIEHEGGLANKTKAITMIKQAEGIYE